MSNRVSRTYCPVISKAQGKACALLDMCPDKRDEDLMLEPHLSTETYDADQRLPYEKGSNMRKAKHILIACLAILQVLIATRFAVAVPMARGGFTSVDDPGFAMPGGILVFSATAVNDGDSTGWFRICVIKVSPLPPNANLRDEVRDEQAVHCSVTLPIDPGGSITFESNKFRMLSVPNETFWILLTVQQQAPIPGSEDGSDLINLTVDDLRVIVVTNFYA